MNVNKKLWHSQSNMNSHKNQVFTWFFFFAHFFINPLKPLQMTLSYNLPNDSPYNPPNEQEEELQLGLKYGEYKNTDDKK